MTSSTDRIEREILLNATRARVWRALSDAEEFGRWFGASLGGQVFATGQWVRGKITIPGYEHLQFEALIVEMQAEQRFAYRWHPYAHDANVDYSQEETTLVVIELHEADGGILLKVVESGFDKLPAGRRIEALRMNSRGWEGQLRNIARHVATP
jgi:uncharacterized protein YndB with AHSA1/START domain